MRLLYFDQYHTPEIASGLHLVEDLLDGMAERNWTVELFAPTPTRGVSKDVRARYKRDLKFEKTRDGHVLVHRISLMSEGVSTVGRALRFMAFSAACSWKALSREYDVVFTGSGPPTQGFVIGTVAKIRHKPFVYNLQDVFPDSLVAAGITKEGSVIWKLGRFIEDKSYKFSTRIIAVSNAMRSNIISKGASAEKIRVVMNWEDVEKVLPVPDEDNSLFEECNIDKNLFTVLYAGNLGSSQNLDVFLDLASAFVNEPIQFLIFGNGSDEERLKRKADLLKLNNVTFFPLQPIDRVSDVYSIADVAFISCAKGVGQSSFPSKTWSILATGTPILAAFDIESDLGDIIQEARIGVIVEPDDHEQLVASLREMKSNPSDLRDMGKRARNYVVENGSKRQAVQRYLDTIVEAYEDKGC